MQPRIVFQQKQAAQPLTNDERLLADHDVDYLLAYLQQQRHEAYELVERPDERERQRAAPDYLFREKGSGRLVAIERTQLMRQDLQAAKARLLKMGADVIVIGPKHIDPVEESRFLKWAITQKVCRGQLQGVAADERILLLRNRLLATENTFLRSGIRFADADKNGVDHCYLIAGRRLLELW